MKIKKIIVFKNMKKLKNHTIQYFKLIQSFDIIYNNFIIK